jgi:four helix bundle protein
MVKPERLRVWRMSHEFAKAVYGVTQSFPKSELYGIVSQMRRASLSVPTNIVEGTAKQGPKECRRFLDIAWASLAETWYLLLFSEEVGLLTSEQRRPLERLRRRTAKLLWGLRRAIANRAKNGV